MSTIFIERTVNLNGPIIPDTLTGVLNCGEVDSHEFTISATLDNEPFALSGVVTANFIRSDGVTVPLTGSISDGAAVVVLNNLCYNVPGRFAFTVFITTEGVTTAIYGCTGTVRQTDSGSIVDPGEIIPSVSGLITAIENAIAEIPADYSQLLATQAQTFSTSKPYVTGEYVWNDGTLYRFTAAHAAGSWTGSDAKVVTIGGELADLKSDIDEQKENPLLFSKLRNIHVYGNLWDEDTKAYGYFQTGAGELVEGGTAWTYSPTYIPVNEGDLILYNNSRPIICAYDKDGNVVSCSQPSWSGYTVPGDVAYLRFSVASTSANGMCIFKDGTSQFEYKSKTKLHLPSLMTEKPIITVDIAGAGDYTSLTEALYDTFEESPDVFVYQGTYDIVAEYKALFGNDIFDNMTYETSGMKGFQWGLYIDNRTVTFASGAKVVCDMSAYTNDGSRRFSPFNLVRNAVLDGCYCYAVNPYYIVHDDFGLDTDIAFTNIIKNCVLISPEPAQGNVIGGGLKKYATKIVDNCYLDNGNNRPVTMRYHNTNYPNATPTVIIKNTRANGIIRVNCYGTQTTKMIAIINNCKANAIEKAYEGSASVDNIDLYEWCNEINS